MQLVTAVPFDEAVAKLGSRSVIGSTLTSSEWQDVPVALRERAMFSSQVESVRFLQRAQDSITDFLTAAREEVSPGVFALKTGGRAHFVDQMQKFLQKEGVERGEGGLRDLTSSARLGLIFNTLTTQANSFGYYKQGMQPDILNEFPAMRFIRVQAVHEPRLGHAPFENKVYLKTDPIWARINRDFGVPWAPFGWGCGHDVEDVDRQEAISLGLLQRGERLQPDAKHFNENLQASSKGLAPELLDKLKKEFGNRLVIEGEVMKWAEGIKKSPPSPRPSPPGEGDKNTSPVSDALDVQVRGTLKNSVKTALAAIDQVHDDGVLPEIPLVSRVRSDLFGYFRHTRSAASGKTAEEIGINPKGPFPALTTLHEVGHFLDLDAIGSSRDFATLGDAIMDDFLRAARATQRISELLAAKPDAKFRELRQIEYLTQPYEIWARAYAQWVTMKSGDPVLLRELEQLRSTQTLKGWTDQDFAPVAAAIEKLFTKLKWL